MFGPVDMPVSGSALTASGLLSLVLSLPTADPPTHFIGPRLSTSLAAAQVPLLPSSTALPGPFSAAELPPTFSVVELPP